MRDGADAPHVREGAFRPRLRQAHDCSELGRGVGARHVVYDLVLRVEDFGQADVRDHDLRVRQLRRQGEATRLQVSVRCPGAVRKRQSYERLPHVFGDRALLEPITLLLDPCDPVGDVAAMALVVDDVYASLFFLDIRDCTDVLVLQVAQSMQPRHGVRHISHTLLPDLLAHLQLIRAAVLDDLDTTERPKPQGVLVVVVALQRVATERHAASSYCLR
mmetsp:Transcript_788/g.2033  ORF Transcript_788/g.2033 Transcript_788/m.2033 type:complete len:218 (-) Transcript_788:41-694(-)